MRTTRQKVMHQATFIPGCVLVGFLKSYVEHKYHPNIWLMAFGLGLIAGLSSQLVSKFPNFLTRAIH